MTPARRDAIVLSAAGAATISPQASRRLEALRVFLLAEVFLGHIAAVGLPTIPEMARAPSAFHVVAIVFRLLTRFGPQAAYLFVFLSGFLVGGGLLRDRLSGRPPAFRAFIVQRMTRILPNLFWALLLSAAFDLSGAFLLGAAPLYRAQNYDYVAALTPTLFFANLLSLQPTFVGAFGSNGPLWTLGYIVQFYLAGFAAVRFLSAPHSWRGAAILAALPIIAFFRHEWLCLFLVWGVGAILRVIRPRRDFGWAPLAFGLALFVFANLLSPLPSILLCGVSGAGMILWAQGARREWPAAARGRINQIASLGYEVYAIHYPATFFIFAVIFGDKATTFVSFLAFLALSTAVVLALAATIRLLVHGADRLALAEAAS